MQPTWRSWLASSARSTPRDAAIRAKCSPPRVVAWSRCRIAARPRAGDAVSIEQRASLSDWRQTAASDADLAVDGVTPRYVVAPTSVDDMGQAVARANEDD